MGGTGSQWLVRGTGGRQRGSVRRLLAELEDKNRGSEETGLAQHWAEWEGVGSGGRSEAGER